MRVVGGKYRRANLNRVNKDTTRETADMVKVAVFNMLPDLQFFHVLDLFSGSGSYGIEALSRGALKVYFVDKDFDAVKTIKNNLAKLKIDNHFVYHMDYMQFLNSFTEKIDLLFLDPPYNLNVYEDIILKISSNMNENSYIVCEMSKDNVTLDKINDFAIIKNKTYGRKRVIIYQKQ